MKSLGKSNSGKDIVTHESLDIKLESKADKSAIPANILTKANLNSEARTMSGLTITPGNGSNSASLYLDFPGGKKYEFFSDSSGAFGVWDKTGNQDIFRIDNNNTTFYKALNVNNKKVFNVPDPTEPQDAANKRWVENTLASNPAQNGKSAYQVARDNGFTGSQTEWLTSLKGKQGVVVSDTEPTDPDIKVWLNPLGETGSQNEPSGGTVSAQQVEDTYTRLANRHAKYKLDANTTVGILNGATVQFIRTGSNVEMVFGGLSWGLFNITAKNTLIRDNNNMRWYIFRTKPNNDTAIVPQGFRTQSSFIVPVYSDDGNMIGSLYVGGVNDSNTVRFQLDRKYNIGDGGFAGGLRLGLINYATIDPFPQAGNGITIE